MRNSKQQDDSIVRVGIDLGTTDSSIAINKGGDILLIKSGPGQPEYTPSVFGVDKSGNTVVGQKAYDRLFKNASNEEFENNKAEVKRLMGTDDTTHFKRLNKSLNAEEISAEILKSLKDNVLRQYPDFPMTSAVITIPAFFSTLQSEATKRAGLLAGFKYVTLLQEPIAAAMAYGLDNTEDKNWLVYDLGGGTFDVALVSSRDGILTVLGHDGDNFLGGKDFDWKIVDEILKPAILEKYKLSDFDRKNSKYQGIFAQLKWAAEIAKIELSQYDSTTVEIENIGQDDDGNDIYVSIDLARKQFEQLISPLIEKTITLAKKTLKDSGVQSSSVSNIVLVGGPTQIPSVRDSLSQAFGVHVDSSVDPLTVVAKGACVYGMSQRVPQEILLESHDKTKDELTIELNYDAMTADDETTITGKIANLSDTDEDYFIQIQSDSGFYSSSKIRLKSGKFYDTVAVETGKTNTYWLYLFDKDGNTVPVYPDSFSVTHGVTVSGAPIPHTIGVIYAKKGFDSNFTFAETCEPYFEKGSIPPLKETRAYKTVKKLVKGEKDELPIKVYEGESANPEANEQITRLSIDGAKLPFDLPEGSEIEITIAIDESRFVTVSAYIPRIELMVDARVDTYSQEIDTDKLKTDLEMQKERFEKLQNTISSDEQSKTEETIESIEKNIENSENDTDDKLKAARDLRELKSDIDKLESEKSIDLIENDFSDKLQQAKDAIDNIPDDNERKRVNDVIEEIEKEGQKAIKDSDKQSLIRYNEQLDDILSAIRQNDPAFWKGLLAYIVNVQDSLTNQTESMYHIEQGIKAAESDDFEELKRHVRSLLAYLPKDEQEKMTSGMSGITK